MTREEISKYAFMNDLPDKPMTCPERCLWYALRDVYRRFSAGDITKEKGDAEKNRALRQFDQDKSKLDLAEKIIQRDASMWMEIELSASMYNLDRTLDNADAFVAAVYGVKAKNREGSPMKK